MSEYKFNCPNCGQHILANEEWGGRPINCPSCNTRLTVPSTAKEPKQPPPTTQPTPKARQKLPSMDVPAKGAEALTAPAPALPAPGKEGQAGKAAATAAETKPGAAATAPKPVEPPRIAVLSPGVKLAMVRAVRRRIADESAWLPGKVKDAAAYAGKMQDGELVLLDAKSPEATRFSLIGAFLREMNERRVVTTAVGRKRFLDEEIPEAIRELLLEQMSDEEHERSEDPLGGQDLLSISHAQCLAALDALEARYSQRVEQRQIESAKRRLGNLRLPELVKKLEGKIAISPEEVATALYHEVMDLRRHVERMESRLDRKNPLSGDEHE